VRRDGISSNITARMKMKQSAILRWVLVLPAFAVCVLCAFALVSQLAFSVAHDESSAKAFLGHPYGGWGNAIAIFLGSAVALLIAPRHRLVVGIIVTGLLLVYGLQKSSPQQIHRETGWTVSAWPMLSWPTGAVVATALFGFRQQTKRER
jgi:hypothetical protein